MKKEVGKMRKTLILMVAFTFILGVAAPVFADLHGSVDKLTNGTMKIVKSPLAIYNHTKGEIDGADYKAIGLFKGLLASPFHFVAEAGKGVLDVATFPIE